MQARLCLCPALLNWLLKWVGPALRTVTHARARSPAAAFALTYICTCCVEANYLLYFKNWSTAPLPPPQAATLQPSEVRPVHLSWWCHESVSSLVWFALWELALNFGSASFVLRTEALVCADLSCPRKNCFVRSHPRLGAAPSERKNELACSGSLQTRSTAAGSVPAS